MSALQVLILAIAAMIGLAALRLARVHFGREPHPERRLLFGLAFILLPPIALGALIRPGSDPLRGVPWVPLYAIALGTLWALMGITALGVRLVVPARSRRVITLALVGSQGDQDAAPIDPPLTAKLAESMAAVDRTNTVFPRGPEFPTQVDRPGFRGAWDALDAATVTLEGRIADDRVLGVGVASAATAMANDARGRLDTLRRLALPQS